MLELKRQKKLIQKQDWDCLVILDACRYDFFEKVYKDYLKGELKKVVSSGCWTGEWLVGTFEDGDFSDVVYVSGHPYVNSKQVEVVEGFKGNNTFLKIIDVWDKYWDESFGQIRPKDMSKQTRLARAKYPDRKIISHFPQPHAPYISLNGPFIERKNSSQKQAQKDESLLDKSRRYFGGIASSLVGHDLLLKFRHAVGLKRSGPVKLVSQKFGDKVLINAYREDLKIVLSECRKLVKRLPGKVIITSDHGECLGEEGFYGHGDFKTSVNNKILKIVPWLEVKKVVEK